MIILASGKKKKEFHIYYAINNPQLVFIKSLANQRCLN